MVSYLAGISDIRSSLTGHNMSDETANMIVDHEVLQEGVHFIQKSYTIRELGGAPLGNPDVFLDRELTKECPSPIPQFSYPLRLWLEGQCSCIAWILRGVMHCWILNGQFRLIQKKFFLQC